MILNEILYAYNTKMVIKMESSQAWWHMARIPTLPDWRLEGQEFKAAILNNREFEVNLDCMRP